MKKWFPLFFYFIILAWGIIHRDFILIWLEDKEQSDLLIFFLLSVLFATIPIIPFTLFGGMMGIKYGLILGFMINWFGGFLAAMVYYLFARFILAGYFQTILSKFRRLEQLRTLMVKNSFLSILILRFIPIIPPLIIHIYSGVNHIPFSIYFIATAIGLVPSMFILAFGGNQLLSNFPQFLIGLVVYAIFVVLIYYIYRFWSRSKVHLAKE